MTIVFISIFFVCFFLANFYVFVMSFGFAKYFCFKASKQTKLNLQCFIENSYAYVIVHKLGQVKSEDIIGANAKSIVNSSQNREGERYDSGEEEGKEGYGI